MEDPNKWTGWLAGLMDSIVDYEGPAALSRAAFCFPKEGGCCYLGDQDIGARFESFHHCVVECHTAECPETAQIISDMMRQHCKSSKELHTRLLIDQLARAVSRKIRLKMGIEIEAKMRVDDFATVRAALSGAGARRVGEVVEENIFFDTPARSLLSAKSGLRLRIDSDVSQRAASAFRRHIWRR